MLGHVHERRAVDEQPQREVSQAGEVGDAALVVGVDVRLDAHAAAIDFALGQHHDPLGDLLREVGDRLAVGLCVDRRAGAEHPPPLGFFLGRLGRRLGRRIRGGRALGLRVRGCLVVGGRVFGGGFLVFAGTERGQGQREDGQYGSTGAHVPSVGHRVGSRDRRL